MHLNFHFTTVQILWTLTFAAQLVLLVVLLGRDRIKHFPWFSLGIVLMALRLLASRLLFGRMPTITLDAIFIAMADLSAIVGFLVVVEMARRAFAPVRRSLWYSFALAVLIVGGGILAAWGPWPAWKTLGAGSFLAVLQLLQLGAQKLDMLIDLLTVELGLLVVLLGRSWGAGWRTHTQRIVIGLSTASCGQLAVEGLWQFIAHTAAPHSQAEYDRIIGLRDKLFNANGFVYIAVLVWWIVVLWIDEPGALTADDAPHDRTPQLEYLSEESGAQEGGAQENDLTPLNERADEPTTIQAEDKADR
jgi:hypothetical protein